MKKKGMRILAGLWCALSVLGCAGRRAEAETAAPEAVHLEVDTAHVYEKMNTSYAEGYVPVVEGDVVYLVVPFVASGGLQDDLLTVGVEMEEDAPFVYANYRKTVKKRSYHFEHTVEAYLFQCEIRLDSVRREGKYPVIVRAVGYSGQGGAVRLASRIFITVSGTADGGSNPQAPGPDAPSDELTGPPEELTGPPEELAGPPDSPEDEQFFPLDGNPGDIQTAPDAEEPAEPSDDMPDTPATEPTEELWEDFADEPLTEAPASPEEEAETETVASSGFYADTGGGYPGGGSYGSSGGAEEEKVYRQPKLTLESNSLSGVRLQAGSKNEFVTVFQNRSQSETVYNLSVSLKAADDSISLSASSFYFDQVAPQDQITIAAIAEAAANAGQKKVSVTFTFDYENVKGTTYSSTQEVSLDIDQPAQVILESFELADRVYAMETVDAALSIRNAGRSPVYNVRAELDAGGLFPMGTVAAGDMEAGTSYDGSIRIYVGNKNMTAIGQSDTGSEDSAYGTVVGTLTLTYEDASGKTCSQTHEFSTVIQKPVLVELAVEEEEEETNQWWPAILTMTVLLFLAVLAGMGRRLRQSRRRLSDLLAKGGK